MSTEGQGLTRYRDGVFTTYTTENGLPDNFIAAIWIGPDGNLIIEVPGKTLTVGTGRHLSRTSRRRASLISHLFIGPKKIPPGSLRILA